MFCGARRIKFNIIKKIIFKLISIIQMITNNFAVFFHDYISSVSFGESVPFFFGVIPKRDFAQKLLILNIKSSFVKSIFEMNSLSLAMQSTKSGNLEPLPL